MLLCYNLARVILFHIFCYLSTIYVKVITYWPSNTLFIVFILLLIFSFSFGVFPVLKYWILGVNIWHIGVNLLHEPGIRNPSESWLLCIQSCLLLIWCWWKCPGSCHPPGEPKLSSMLLPLNWSTPGCCRFWGKVSQRMDHLTLCHCLSNKIKTNKMHMI